MTRRQPMVHWIHSATIIPGIFRAWCGARVWPLGPTYRSPRPLGVIGDPPLPQVTCGTCRSIMPKVYTLAVKPSSKAAAYARHREKV